MPTGLALALLAISLVLTLAAARTFARRLDVLGVALGLPEALVGLLTALAADGPEISSALVALAKGEHGVGVGVVLGSNAFNLAAMIGLSALLGGAVALRRRALAIEGAMGLLAILLAAGVLLGALAPALGAILLACGGVPYVVVLLRSRPRYVSPEYARPRARARVRPRAHTPRIALWMGADVALIVAGSFGMVQAAGTLSDRFAISGTLVGLLALGPLTSIPNALTGVRLGLAGRGPALVSETLNSNTINLAGGIMAPALLTGVGVSGTAGHLELAWLAGMTVVCLLALARRRGAGRGTGVLLLALYAGFVAVALQN